MPTLAGALEVHPIVHPSHENIILKIKKWEKTFFAKKMWLSGFDAQI